MTTDRELLQQALDVKPSQPEALYALQQAIRAHLAQPEAPAQEPVAWLQIGISPLHDGTVIARTTKPKHWNPEWWRFEPLIYATPAQRKPLTDEQIEDLYFDGFSISKLKDFARAVEAAHNIGEKK